MMWRAPHPLPITPHPPTPQVHDEVMLEGPRETAEEAKQRVVACMENPWENLEGFKGKPLLVDLVVDCKSADTWYEAK